MPILLSPSKQKILPIVPLREVVIFPHVETILSFGQQTSIAAIEAAFNSERLVCFFTQRNSKIEELTKDDLYQIGTLGKIERLLRTENELHAWIKGISRVRLESVEALKPFMVGKVIEIPEFSESSDEITALTNNLIKNFQEAVNLGKVVDVMMVMRLLGENTPTEVADQISYILDLKTADKQGLLETISVKERLLKTADYLTHELKVLELERTIDSKTRKKFDKSMRESILRERKRVIEEELGEVAEEEDEIKELKQKIHKVKMPPEVEKKAQKELKRLSGMNPNHPEFAYIRTYLDWLTEMPWSLSTPNKVSISAAAKILDEDHWGLEKVKERVVEYLAVMKLREKQKKRNKEGGPTILCFVGPPGVGKTSIGKSIARALGRKFIRMSLGGIRDEAEIRGHRRTYVGAMPGRIIQGIRNAGTNNPVFMLDEIDKVGADFRGDPSAALLEALDPEQNREFSDHYLEVPFDLSRVMFITTANILDTIPPALRDRMETIPFPGYTELEKFHIARKYLWGKQLVFNGLKKDEIKIADGAIYEIIRRYTREAGVRELERCLATICRKLARKVLAPGNIPRLWLRKKMR
jgi:ATP-dependent Lon protease